MSASTCTPSARAWVWSGCRCSGVSNPIRIPERRAAGWVWGRPPPTCAGSSRWVPSLEGLGQAKTPRCLPRHVVRPGWSARRHVLRGSCWRLNPGERLAVVPLTCPKVAWRLGAALARPQLVLVWGACAAENWSRDRAVEGVCVRWCGAPGRCIEAAAPRGVDSGSAMRGDQAGRVGSACVAAGRRRRRGARVG